MRAWEDAAELVDGKWERAFAQAQRVREGYARLLDDGQGHITLAESTHELLVRFLSALPLVRRPRLVTTSGEYHSLRRQLDRLAEEGIEIARVDAHPTSQVAERLIEAVDERTAAVLASAVFFRSAQIVRDLGAVLGACQASGAELLVDAYHASNVVPFSLREQGLEEAYVVGGGYKYCQLGEGNAFLRAPRDCRLRPVVTGWFADFGAIIRRGEDPKVRYGDGPARFAGATYDPTSNCRAAEVFAFFEEQELTPDLLREVSQHQVGLLIDAFDELDLDPRILDRDRSVALEDLGGFLALRSPRAGDLQQQLVERGLVTDFREKILRLGPAPYLSDDQLRESMAILGEVAKSLEPR